MRACHSGNAAIAIQVMCGGKTWWYSRLAIAKVSQSHRVQIKAEANRKRKVGLAGANLEAAAAAASDASHDPDCFVVQPSPLRGAVKRASTAATPPISPFNDDEGSLTRPDHLTSPRIQASDLLHHDITAYIQH